MKEIRITNGTQLSITKIIKSLQKNFCFAKFLFWQRHLGTEAGFQEVFELPISSIEAKNRSLQVLEVVLEESGSRRSDVGKITDRCKRLRPIL